MVRTRGTGGAMGEMIGLELTDEQIARIAFVDQYGDESWTDRVMYLPAD
jgi:hypothetical protein